MHRPTFRAGALIALFTFCWALVEHVGPAAQVSPYQVVWTRYGVHLALMLVAFGPRYGTSLVRTARPGRQIACSLLMLGMPVCFILAAQRLPGPDALGVFWIAPVLIVVISAASGGRHAVGRTLAATVVGLLGAVLICKPDAGVLRPAALLAVGMALCFSLYVVGMASIHEDPILVKLFHTALWVFVALTLLQPFVWRTPGPRALAAMGVIGVLGWVGLYALDRAIDVAPPAIVAPVLYTQLAWDVLLRWNHHPARDMATLIGVLLVLVAASSSLIWRGGLAAPDPARIQPREVPV